MSLADMLAKRQTPDAENSNQATGMESSTEGAIDISAPSEKETASTIMDAPKGSYIQGRLNKVIRANGSILLPVAGVFTPVTEEDKELLAYFAQRPEMVTLVE